MQVDEMYPSSYLKSSDIPSHGRTLVINRLLNEQLRDGDAKWIVYFRGEKRGLVLNKTNASNIAQTLGNDTDAWIGKSVTLAVHKVSFQGKLVDGIRATVPDPFDDDIPL